MWTGLGQVKWVVQKCGLTEDRSSGWCRNVDCGQVKWVVQKCGLTEDRSSGLCRNMDWLRTGQVGFAVKGIEFRDQTSEF